MRSVERPADPLAGASTVQSAPGQSRSWLAPMLLMSPTLLLLTLFFAVPLGTVLVFSVYRAEPGGVMIPGFTLTHYRRFLTDPLSLRVLWNTLVLGIHVTAGCLVLAFPVAYSLARTRRRGLRGIMLALLLVPLMTSVVVRSYGWTIVLADNGWLNMSLMAVGLINSPVRLLYTFTGTVIALMEVFLPFMVLSLAPVIQNIDRNLEYAAQSLGANRWRTFVDILLPLSVPGILAGSILVFALTIAAFATPALVGGAKTLLMATYVYQQALTVFNWPFGAAISFVLLALVLCLIVVQTRLVERKKEWGFRR
jgi:putative spermidine/putrescine transport system permease protein